MKQLTPLSKLAVFGVASMLTFGCIGFQRIASSAKATEGESDEATIVRNERPEALAYLLRQQDRMELPRIFRHERADRYRMKVGAQLAILFYPELTPSQRRHLQMMANETGCSTPECTANQKLLAQTLQYYERNSARPTLGWSEKWSFEQLRQVDERMKFLVDNELAQR